MEAVQTILFENKEKMPDGVYLQLQNELKTEFEKKEKNDKKTMKCYKITIVSPELFMDLLSSYKHSQISMKREEKIVCIPIIKANQVEEAITKDGAYFFDNFDNHFWNRGDFGELRAFKLVKNAKSECDNCGHSVYDSDSDDDDGSRDGVKLVAIDIKIQKAMIISIVDLKDVYKI